MAFIAGYLGFCLLALTVIANIPVNVTVKYPDRMPAWTSPVVPATPARFIEPLACGPYYCDATKRWRDPATKRFVKSPVL